MQIGVRDDADVAKLRQLILERELDRVAGVHANRRCNLLPLPVELGPAVGVEFRLQRQ